MFETRSASIARLVAAWEDAQDSLTLEESVGLALRSHRSVMGLGQRSYAQDRGWSKSHGARLESAPQTLKLADVLSALEGTGYHLVLHRDRDDAPVAPVEWPVTELVARFSDGRRLPAAANPVRSWCAHSWFFTRHPEAKETPDWTWTTRRRWDGRTD
ncbi:hypothetical protein BJ986_001307 [Phycicoccus badiiscoriae]|uniref:Uncharacterized protein n=1 Tax=Pedococcus badiiscoriae TaxID=642776 RepID=A0A852WDP0_9MICO|nr:hypothetical protein [Pedococcus badiiscoriae]NYG06820.1 hypothetical protein [Pedococcus badiiscoriae]